MAMRIMHFAPIKCCNEDMVTNEDIVLCIISTTNNIDEHSRLRYCDARNELNLSVR
jgi:hypothetical protein